MISTDFIASLSEEAFCIVCNDGSLDQILCKYLKKCKCESSERLLATFKMDTELVNIDISIEAVQN